MPVKLLTTVRLLHPLSLPVTRNPFSTMKLKTDPHAFTCPATNRVVPVISRVFPHKLKYRSFSSFPIQRQNLKTQLSNGRKFSTRRPVHEVRASKSLIEDEAELSDWVSGLRSDPLKTNKNALYSESDDNDSYSGGNGNRSSSNKNDRGAKRRRGSDTFNDSDRKIGPRHDPLSARKGRFSNDVSGRGYGERGFDQRGRGGNRDDLRSRGRSDVSGRGYGERVFDQRGRGGNRDELRSRGRSGFDNGGRGSEGGRIHREKCMDSRERFTKGSRGEGMFGRNEKRGFELGNGKRNRDGGRSDSSRGGKVKGRGIHLFSDDEDVDDEKEGKNGYMRFRELLNSEDENSEELVDEDEDEIDSEEGEAEDDEFQKGSTLSRLGTEESVKVSRPSSPGSNSYLSETRFDQCSISPLSLKGLKDVGYEKMTMVQEATLPVILKGKDVLAKAKTGTGKTVAFLLPSIEVVIKAPPVARDQKQPPILVLVICPTRELASQAAAEANTLLKYHPSIGVQVVIGGTRVSLEQKRMQANPCQILVATPGRLKDHMENTAGFATRLKGVKVLVLDEADQLLDMGFRKDIEKIVAAVPKQRQTLLFSATVPQEVRQICHIALKRDHEFISTVQEGTEETHAQVRQMHLVAPLDKHFPFLYTLLKEHVDDDVDYKVLVFCTTAMVTKLVAELLSELNLNVREIHSRKSQTYRTRVSDEFRKSKGLILVTSDVSARGVDYPDVTLVVQIGLPADREQYIHRLGRTGRKGKEGQGILLLAPWEEFFLSSVKDLPIAKAPLPLVDPETKKKVERALSQVEMKSKESAYQAWLGYYNSSKVVGRDKYRLVELANEFSRTMGLDNPPAIPKLVLGKMGLKNIPGLRSK